MKCRTVIIIAGVAMALARCASTSSQYAQQSRHAPTSVDSDMQYIADVEAEASRRGVDVYWVHPPKRRAPIDQ
ncbi:MAG: hypothetical protein IPK27_01695 [Rhodanobacteraceae bacterium]|nr:hypothetical protein [Rhodanobacteraceae bacterium]